MTIPKRRTLLATGVLALAVGMAGCSPSDPADEPTTGAISAPSPSTTPSTPDVEPTTTDAPPEPGPEPEPTPLVPVGAPTDVATGLTSPWSLVFHEGTPLISERDTGRILELDGDGAAREVLLVADVVSGSEGGLLGLAVDGAGHLFAYSTGPDGNRIQRWDIAGAAGSLRLENERTLLDGLPSARFHNGGRLALGPDGMLYATVGDAGDRPSAQDLEKLSGKILRLTTDGEVPADNPFPGSPVYSYGHRNPQGLGWAEDGTMFSSEFGQDTWDELNIIVAGGNYGWPRQEGAGGDESLIDPVQQWAPADASPSGLAVHEGTVYIANLRGERLRAVPVADPTASTDLYPGEFGRLRAVAPAPDGSLWFITGNTNSRLGPREGDDRVLRVELG